MLRNIDSKRLVWDNWNNESQTSLYMLRYAPGFTIVEKDITLRSNAYTYLPERFPEAESLFLYTVTLESRERSSHITVDLFHTNMVGMVFIVVLHALLVSKRYWTLSSHRHCRNEPTPSSPFLPTFNCLSLFPTYCSFIRVLTTNGLPQAPSTNTSATKSPKKVFIPKQCCDRTRNFVVWLGLVLALESILRRRGRYCCGVTSRSLVEAFRVRIKFVRNWGRSF